MDFRTDTGIYGYLKDQQIVTDLLDTLRANQASLLLT